MPAHDRIYLASPYSHEDPWVREERYLAVARTVSQLLVTGHWVYSPILYWHELAKIAGLPKDAAFWKRSNMLVLAVVDKLCILQLSGWQDSAGVKAEVEEARERGLPIEYL